MSTIQFKVNFVSAIFLILSSHLANGQRPVRMELPSRIDVPVYHLETLGSYGLLLFYESNEINEAGKRKWYFSLHNTLLEEEWLQFVELADGMVLKQIQKTGNRLYMLFSMADKKRSDQPGFQLLSYDIDKQSFDLIGGSLPDKAEVTAFVLGNTQALITLSLPRYESDALLLNLQEGNLISLPLHATEQSILQTATFDQEAGLFLLALKQYESSRFESDLFVAFDENANQNFRIVYNDPQERFIHSFVMQSSASKELLIIGSYNNRDRRDQRIREGSPDVQNEAAGLFYILFNDQHTSVTAFYDFKNFSNIYSSLSVQDLMRARQRQVRSRKQATNVPIQVAFQFYNQQLIPYQGNLVYAAEAFRPQYRTETRMDYDFYGRPIPYTYTIFEGFNFFNYMLAGFDRQGNLLWNNDFEMREVLSFEMKPNMIAIPDSAMLILAYNNKGRITSKLINKSKTIGSVEQIRNDTFYPTDRLQEENFSGIKYWYNQYYITYGYQRIANNRLRDNNLRSVFYINKIALE
jgi:hypothetical protein